MTADRRIAAFIAENRAKYTREAITQQLLEAGYERDAIEATWAALEAPDPDSPPDTRFWSRFWWMLLGVNLAVLIGVGLLTGLLFNLQQGAPLLVVLAVVLALGALISWAVVAAVGPDKMGRTASTAIGITIPLLFALLIGGGCYALIGSIGPPPQNATIELSVEGREDLSGTGTGSCTIRSPTNFDVFGQREGDGFVSFSVNVIPSEGEGLDVNIFVTREPRTETERGESWSTYLSQDATVEADVSSDAREGTVTFTGLRSEQSGPEFEGPVPDPISGSVSWSCD